jgi:hypothetical protein
MKLRILVAAGFAVALSTAAHAEDVKFDLVNKSSYQIDEFYASPATTDDWEEDILGQDVLEGGQSVTITVADGSDQCAYDLKAVEENGTEHELEGVDICKNPTVEFNK